jgi:hypothetical protein
MPELTRSFRRSMKRKANYGAQFPRLILWFADSFPRFLVFPGCAQENRVRFGPWNRRTFDPSKRFPIFLRPGVVILLVTFGGWDPYSDGGLIPEMRTAALSLLGSRGANEVTDVWVSGGINHFRDRPRNSTAPRSPAVSDRLGNETVNGLINTFEAVGSEFPRASLRFLGSGYMPEGRAIRPHDIPHQLEVNRVSHGVFDRVSAYLVGRLEQASEQEREARGPDFASGHDLFRDWQDHHVGDKSGHPSNAGYAEMRRRLFNGPSRSLLAHDQDQPFQ